MTVRQDRQTRRPPWRAAGLCGERKALMAVRPFVPGAEDELDRSIRTTAYGELQFQRSIEFIRIRMLFS